MTLKMVSAGTVMAAGLLLAMAGDGLSQEAPSASWAPLVRCTDFGDRDARLDCYDDALNAAGYAPKPEAVAAARRKVFGLTVPQLGVRSGRTGDAVPEPDAQAPVDHSKESDGRVVLTLARTAVQSDGRLLFVSSENQVWEQTDFDRVIVLPEQGASIAIRRTRMGGYFCAITSKRSVRCRRLR